MVVVSQSDPMRVGADASGALGALGGSTSHTHKARVDVSGRSRTRRIGSCRRTMMMTLLARTWFSKRVTESGLFAKVSKSQIFNRRFINNMLLGVFSPVLQNIQ